jgi:peptidoglycan-N-acetylglucosamine deacetylase
VRSLWTFVTVAVGLVGIFVSGWLLSRSLTFQVAGEIIDRVPASEKIVALTFDDGPSYTGVKRLLPILRDADVKATFFVVGKALDKNPELGRRLVDEGHALGNHSYSHKRMIMKSSVFIDYEISRTDELIRSTGYSGPIYFRPPYGKKLVMLPYYLDRTNRTTIMWDVAPDSFDEIVDAKGIIDAAVRDVRPGSIVLLHSMASTGAISASAVPGLIERLRSDGYRFVTVPELIELAQPNK